MIAALVLLLAVTLAAAAAYLIGLRRGRVIVTPDRPFIFAAGHGARFVLRASELTVRSDLDRGRRVEFTAVDLGTFLLEAGRG